MQGSTIYFAGAESEVLTRALLDNGVRHILYSYFFIEAHNRGAFIERMQQEYPGVDWILDSGAFSFMTHWKKAPGKLPPPRKYRKRYMKYIEAHGARYSRIAELDLDWGVSALPEQEVAEWLEEMLTLFPDYGIMPIWHPSRGFKKWEEYLADPRIKYVGLGGGTANESIGTQRRLVMAALKAGKPVHGMAMTKTQTTLRQVPYSTVDSTSWLMGQKYGTLYVFRHNRFYQLGKSPATPEEKAREGYFDQGLNRRHLFKAYFRAIGVDPLLMDDSKRNLRRICRLREMQVRRAVRQYRKNNVTLTDEEAAQKLTVVELRKANIIAWRMLADRAATIQRQRGQSDRHAHKDRGQDAFVSDAPKERGIITSLFLGRGGAPPKERDGVFQAVVRERSEDAESYTQAPRERVRGPQGLVRAAIESNVTRSKVVERVHGRDDAEHGKVGGRFVGVRPTKERTDPLRNRVRALEYLREEGYDGTYKVKERKAGEVSHAEPSEERREKPTQGESTDRRHRAKER